MLYINYIWFHFCELIIRLNYGVGIRQMQKKKKKKYVKPKITKIKLDVKTAVLSVCKVQAGSGGPMNLSCRGVGDHGHCLEHGS